MKCRYCASNNSVKCGKRNNRNSITQIFKCRECTRRFSDSDRFLHSQNSEGIISQAMYLYFEGLSLRKISRYLNNFRDTNVSHSTIHSWIMQYTEMVRRYLDPIVVDAYSTWQIDEMVINIKGQHFWLWNVIDEDSRFFICTKLTEERRIEDAMDIIRIARSRTQKDPNALVSDGLGIYKSMFKKVFGENSKTTYHIWGVSEKKIYFNNFVERLNGSIREKVKVTRAYKELYSAQTIINGWQIHYNFVRPHSSIGNMTPAEKAGIKLDLGKDKWLGLIRESCRN